VPTADAVIGEDAGLLTATMPVGTRTLTLQTSRAEVDHTLAQMHAVELVADAVTVLVAGVLTMPGTAPAGDPLARQEA
jgi:hypothetical protein